MDRLMNKYFNAELTEAESKALSRRLATSEEAAWRFAEKAKEIYADFGLPEPPGAQSGIARFFKPGWGKLMTVIATLGGIVVGYWLPKPEKGHFPETQDPPGIVVKSVTPFRQPLIPTQRRIQAPPNSGLETDYRSLSVVVDQESDGVVTVRIFDPTGVEVRRLYDGPLAAGKWSFVWDGILDDGMPALAGTYRIVVEGGSISKSREIIIH